MHRLLSFSTREYTPISFRDRYLYDTYDQITSYLTNKLPQQDLDRLLKPVMTSSGTIEWFGKDKIDYVRINELETSISDGIKTEFHDFIERTRVLIEPLKYKKDTDSNDWAELIGKLFDPESIILCGNNSGQWVMLWGWNFQNTEENRRPVIDRPPAVQPPVEPPIVQPPPVEPPIVQPPPVEPLFIHPPDPPVDTDPPGDSPFQLPVDPPVIDKSNNVGCLGRIVRILRWISYRFWGLFWLIIYTLLVIWLCRYCNRPNCDAYCEKLKETKKELKLLEERVRERCDTTYVRH